MYCTKCGAKLGEGSRFCSKCGTAVGEIAMPDGVNRRSRKRNSKENNSRRIVNSASRFM